MKKGRQNAAAGRKLARTGWIQHLKNPPPTDLDALLRLVDLASHYRAKPVDIVSFFERAVRERAALSKREFANRVEGRIPSLHYLAIKKRWETPISIA